MNTLSHAPLLAASLFSVVGKVAVVTGGGRGIGEMIARTYVENGAKVYICSRSEETLRRTATRLSTAGPGVCIPLAEDLSSEEGCRALAHRFGELEERLHILVNNSGVSWGAAFEDFPEKQWDRVMSLNVKSIFLLTRALRPYLERGAAPGAPGRVINVGSVAGIQHQPVPTYSYDVSKAAVHALTRRLSSELAPTITVNAIAPGFVPSRMSRGLLAYAAEDDINRGVPMGRMGNAADMGGAALYLASPAASWVTGVILPVDGGTTCQPIAMVPSHSHEGLAAGTPQATTAPSPKL